jgi:quinol monooxygenase YgiN
MIVIQVQICVKPEAVDLFIAATIENARNSRQEAGIARFDFVQHSADPTRFLLYEAYLTAEAVDAHKETHHYQVWRDAVVDMMAETRVGTRFVSVFPPDSDW